MENFYRWTELTDTMIGKGIVAGNPDTGLIVLSDGTIVDLSLRSLSPALASKTFVLLSGVPPTGTVVERLTVVSHSLGKDEGYVTELRTDLARSTLGPWYDRVLMRARITAESGMPGISNFLLANHIKYIRGAELVRQAELQEGATFPC